MSDSVDEASFDADVLQAKEPVLVDFWAPWCGPCKMISPLLDEISVEYSGRLKVVKVNIDDCHDIAAKFGVRSIPSLMIFREGSMIASRIGSLTKSQLVAFIDENC